MKCETFSSGGRVVSGVGCLAGLGDVVRRLGARRVLVVTDPGVAAAGLAERLLDSLPSGPPAPLLFDRVEPEPTVPAVQDCLAAGREMGAELVVGLGGGSSMDVAKLVSVLLTNPGPVQSYYGIDLVPGPGVPLVCVPTTAGTGSEATNIAVLRDEERGIKAGVVSDHIFAACALLDPELTLGMPPALTAATGMDALSHALESYTGTRGSPFTDALNLAALELIGKNLPRAFADGGDIMARANMLQASCMAGMAFTNTQNALCHALAMAIGASHRLPHGLLCAITLPWAMEFNLTARPGRYARVARALGRPVEGLGEIEAAGQAVEAVRGLLEVLGISCRLGSHRVPRQDLPAIAEATLATQTRLLANNPREVTLGDALRLLEENY